MIQFARKSDSIAWLRLAEDASASNRLTLGPTAEVSIRPTSNVSHA